MSTFRKVRAGAGGEYYRAEAAGLRWLSAAASCPVPDVVSVADDCLIIQRVPTGSATPSAARRFGGQLARLHLSGAQAFGSPPPQAPEGGWIADLPMAFGQFTSFGPMYAQLRVLPYVEMAQASGVFSESQCATFEELASALMADDPRLVGPPEPASRLHGDLWDGNVLWSTDVSGDSTGWLIDPAAHGGHRETDLAMLALFGAPHLAVILAGYHAAAPLAAGWRSRLDLHQVYPLLVHSVLFGGDYPARAHAAAARALRALH
jgi:fructosamine-3-kinase